MQPFTMLAADFTIKSTLILLFAIAVTFLMRKNSAAVRHRVWCLSFASILAIPFLSPVIPRLSIPFPDLPIAELDGQSVVFEQPAVATLSKDNASAAEPVPTDAKVSAQATDSADEALLAGPAGAVEFKTAIVATAPSEATSETFDIGEGRLSLSNVLAVAWLLGVLVCVMPLVWSFLHVRSEAQSAAAIESDAWIQQLDDASTNLGMNVDVRLLRSPKQCIPVTFGFLRPVVLLPADCEDWTCARRQTVLLHELAHIRRGDLLGLWLARLACAVCWFHPLAWFGLRRLRLEGEQACDDCVVASGQKASDYAAELVAIAEGYVMPRRLAMILGMARSSKLETRLNSLFDRSRSHRTLSLRESRLLLLPAVGLTLLLIALQPAQLTSAQEPKEASSSPVKKTTTRNSDPANTTIDTSQPFKVEQIARMPLPAVPVDGSSMTTTDEDQALIAVRGKPARVWDPAGENEQSRLRTLNENGFHVGLVPNSTLAYVQQWEYVQFVNLESGKSTGARLPFELREDTVIRPAVSPKGNRVVTRSTLKSIRFYDLTTQKPITGEIEQEGIVYRIDFSEDGKWLFSQTPKRLKIWDPATGREVAGPLLSDIYRNPYHPSGKLATFDNLDGDSEFRSKATIHNWNGNTWSAARVIELPGHVRQAYWIRSNRLLVVGAKRGERGESFRGSPIWVVSLDANPPKLESHWSTWWIAGAAVAPDAEHFITRTYRATTCWKVGQDLAVWRRTTSAAGKAHNGSFGDSDWVLLHERGKSAVIVSIATGKELWRKRDVIVAKASGPNIWLLTKDGVERWRVQGNPHSSAEMPVSVQAPQQGKRPANSQEKSTAKAGMDLASVRKQYTASLVEPKYKHTPSYTMVVFGSQASKRMLVALDGFAALYADINGNGKLTDEGERFEATRVEKYPPGRKNVAKHHFDLGTVGKAKIGFEILEPAKDYEGRTPIEKRVIQLERDNHWIRAGLLRLPGAAGRDGTTAVIFIPKAANSQVSWIDGPLTIIPDPEKRRRAWELVPRSKPGQPKEAKFSLTIGTLGLPPTSFTGIIITPLSKLEHPKDKYPQAEFKFSSGATKVTLAPMRFAGRFSGIVEIPRDETAARIKVLLSYPGWPDNRIQPTSRNVPID